MLTAKDIQIGQRITTGLWFREREDHKDYAIITGKVIRKLECYNQVLVDVELENSFNSPLKSVWVRVDKSDIEIIN